MKTREPIVLDSTNPPETVHQSLSDHLVEIKRLHDVRINPSLKPSVQEYEFINNQQKFTLHIQFSEKGIECSYEDANKQFKRPAASPIRQAVDDILKTQLVSEIGEQARHNILGVGAFSMFHHEKKPQEPTPPAPQSNPKPHQ